MHPICFYIGNKPIYWYGVLMATAFLVCIGHWTLLGKREGRDSAFASDLALWLMISGIAGARLGYVLANIGVFMKNPIDIARIDKGGLVFFGGLIGAGIAVIVFAAVKKEKLWPLADFTVSALPLGHAIGRIGCFLNGCCYGTPSNLPWSVKMHGEYRHPVQLYESILNLGVYFILLAVYRRKPPGGRVFALYLLLYPTERFMLEFLRGDERLLVGTLNAAQVVCLALLATGVAVWFLAPLRRNLSETRQ
jgi:phosphatidylglycerol---prolipoprotein diacylglyceryl transferase